ncbi:MAG TPA: M20/M25/M40 family metallo-hydrolase [Synergistales bacterium]|nr:M20/M25/M40 family metallo-hydrolase [Synergistales bacterium]
MDVVDKKAGRAMDRTFDRAATEKLLSELVRIPSPYFEEKEIMGFAREWLEGCGVPAEFHHFHEKKIYDYRGINVIGTLEGGLPGPKVVLNGHLDTVKLCSGWTREPFGAPIEGNRMFGLGACDMKSGCAAIMLALQEFVKDASPFRGSIHYSLVCDEEGPFGLGTDALILDGKIPPDADVALITEPSSAFADVGFPSICLGARGGWNYSVRVRGRSAHGAQPEKGINAVSEAAKILLELEKSELKPHEKLGPGSICCVEFHGGGAALSVPDEAFFNIFRHVVVGETRETVIREAEEAVRRACIKGKADISFRVAPHEECDGFPAYVTPEDHEMVRQMVSSIREAMGREPAFSYFSSVGDFCYTGGRLGIPTLVVGPKGGNFHAADEYVELDTVVATAGIVYRFLCRMAGRVGGE